MITPDTSNPPAPVHRWIAYAKWAWIAGAIFTTVVTSAVLIMLHLYAPETVLVTAIFSAVNLAQALLAVIAAINLKPGRNWARITLIVLGFLCIFGALQAIKDELWMSLITNLVLGSTAPVLLRKDVKDAFTKSYC